MQSLVTLFFLSALGLGLAVIWHMVSAHSGRIVDALMLRVPEAPLAPSAEILPFPRRMTVQVPNRLAA